MRPTKIETQYAGKLCNLQTYGDKDTGISASERKHMLLHIFQMPFKSVYYKLLFNMNASLPQGSLLAGRIVIKDTEACLSALVQAGLGRKKLKPSM